MIEIKEVKTKKQIRLFATYPLKLYKGCPYYVPSLRSDEMNTFNPKKNFNLLENKCKAFLCYKDGEIVGRIAGLINNTYNKINSCKYIRFSRFECIDDLEVFKALLGAVENFAKENGIEYMHGPWGFNDTDREGMLTYGFSERSTYATNYYYPYFHKRMEELGYEKESEWLERRFVIPDKPYDRIVALGEKMMQKLGVIDVTEKMSFRKIVEVYGDKWFDTLNQSYGELDGYVPVVDKAKKNVLKQFIPIINPRYISILVDKNDNVAGFGIVLPSICEPLIKHKGKLFPFGFVDVLKCIRKPKELEMALVGIRDEYKNTGLNSVLMTKIMKNIIEDKVEKIESNPMLVHNYDIQHQWKFSENEVVKKRQTYKKKIGNQAD